MLFNDEELVTSVNDSGDILKALKSYAIPHPTLF